MTMKKLQMLTATAGIILALAGPSLAASRTHQAADAYASGDVSADRSGAYNYGPVGGERVRAPVQQQYQYGSSGYTGGYAGQNLPYADRPYGDPDSW
jgi:hypothetical protein